MASPDKEVTEEQALALDALKSLARARERQLATRFIIALIGFGFLSFDYNSMVSAVSMAVLVASQIVDLIIRRRIVPPRREAPVRLFDRSVLFLSSLQAAVFYTMIPVYAWLTGDPGYQLFGGIWLAGSMVHVMLMMHHDRANFLATFLPPAIAAFALPTYSLFFGTNAELMTTLAMLFATTMFIGHVAVAYPTFANASRTLHKDRLEAEKRQVSAERASQAKTDFLATLSHEIRTPMNGIIGMASALDEADLPDDVRDKVDVMRQATDILLVLVNDVLDLSKIEAGKITLEERPFNLEALVQRVSELFRVEAERKGIRLDVEIDSIGDHLRLGDEHRLTQVLQNLIGNAVKFTDEGRVGVRVSKRWGGTEQLRIIVEDTGIGMSPEEAKRIFEPFAQAEASTTREFGGTGLGLTITKGIVEVMGGRLTADTEKGRGSSFTIEIDLPFAEESTYHHAFVGEDEGRSISGCRVLAVDDNAVNLQVLEVLLNRLGAYSVLASGGREGLELFENSEFDLVLLDITMPDLDGPSVLRQMASFAEMEGRTMPPVVAVSAHVLTEDIEAHLAEGFAGYVTKPIRIDDLNRVASRALSGGSPSQRRSRRA